MADDGGGGGGRAKGLIPMVLGTIATLGLAIMLIQLVFNPPERRPRVVCYPLYKAGMFGIVTIPKYALPGDTTFVLNNISRMDSFYAGCKSSMGWLKSTPAVTSRL